MSKSAIISLFILGAIIIAGVLVWQLGYLPMSSNVPNPAACTQEAKICPDGSSVSRTGPNCEFAECSDINPLGDNIPSDNIADWATYKNEDFGYIVQYPKDLFVTSQDYYKTYEDWSLLHGLLLRSVDRELPIDWMIRVHKDEDKTLQEWITSTGNIRSTDNIIPITIDGFEGRRISWVDEEQDLTIIYVAKGDFIYDIAGANSNHPGGHDEEVIYDSVLFEKMLSTFKFIN